MRVIVCCLLVLFASHYAFAFDEMSESDKYYQWLHGQKHFFERLMGDDPQQGHPALTIEELRLNPYGQKHFFERLMGNDPQQGHPALTVEELRLNPYLNMDLPFFPLLFHGMLELVSSMFENFED